MKELREIRSEKKRKKDKGVRQEKRQSPRKQVHNMIHIPRPFAPPHGPRGRQLLPLLYEGDVFEDAVGFEFKAPVIIRHHGRTSPPTMPKYGIVCGGPIT